MKTLFFSLTLFIAGIHMSFAQLKSDDIFEEYSGKKGVTSVFVTKQMFEIFANSTATDELDEFRDLVSEIDRIKIMTVVNDTEHPGRAKDFYKKAKASIPKNYQEMMDMRKEGELITVYLDEKKDKVTEVVMLISQNDSTVLLSISGNIDLAKLTELSEKMNIKGMENLNSIDK